jgi:CRISPR-associated protein Csm1
MQVDLKLLDQTCRVALAGLLHDLGKLTQRARVHDEQSDSWRAHLTLYCPFNQQRGYHTHHHAAATALAFDSIEKDLPPVLRGDVSPFATRETVADSTDSLVNVAAMHHRPDTFLQWCIAAGDRISSGFERTEFEDYNGRPDDFLKARMLVPFEEFGKPAARTPSDLKWRYPMKPLSAGALFPEKGAADATQGDYAALWTHLLSSLRQVPVPYRSNWALWLDAFDAAWLSATHSVPSATAFGTKPDVSLYDHSRATAAFAAAIWRYHVERQDDEAAVVRCQRDRSDWDEKKLLIVQGDFSGIQSFIFGGNASTQKGAARLLRGRSALVALLSDLAALRVLEEMSLPPTAQVINAAGKFMIVAPNTRQTQAALSRVRSQLDAWFLKNSFGLASVVFADVPASCNDFVGGGFARLRERLSQALERAKRQRFSLGSADAPDPLMPCGYASGPCRFDGRLPAETEYRDEPCAYLSKDQMDLGRWLAQSSGGGRKLLAIDRGTAVKRNGATTLVTDFFGYRISLCAGDASIGDTTVRVFDLSLPGGNAEQPLFAGHARREVNAYVPVISPTIEADPRFADLRDPGEPGDLMTFEHMACDARSVSSDGSVTGVAAIGVLKGDVDDMGRIFATALGERPTFAAWSALSRRVSAFFSVVVPHLCERDARFRSVYTVFAGGDDFFFIGPWLTIKRFAAELRNEFRRYCAENDELHFSAAYMMTKPGFPLRHIIDRIEVGLDAAKSLDRKDAVHLADRTDASAMKWREFLLLQKQSEKLGELVDEADLSTGFLYDALDLADMAERSRKVIADARWRALLAYRTRRHVQDMERANKVSAQAAESLLVRIAKVMGEEGMAALGGKYRHVISDHLYTERKR